MQAFTANPKHSPDDPDWSFLAEFSLNEFLLDRERRDEPAIGLLFQAVRELGVLPEWLKNIETALAEFSQEALVHLNQGGRELPARVRVFCRRNTLSNIHSECENSGLFHAAQSIEQTQTTPDFDSKRNGGWGYFLIERGESVSAALSANSESSIDLYLYREGK